MNPTHPGEERDKIANLLRNQASLSQGQAPFVPGLQNALCLLVFLAPIISQSAGSMVMEGLLG